MVTALLIIFAVIVIVALVVGMSTRSRGRLRSRAGRIVPASDQMDSAAHVPDDDELRMRAQAHREAAVQSEQTAADLHTVRRAGRGVAPDRRPR